MEQTVSVVQAGMDLFPEPAVLWVGYLFSISFPAIGLLLFFNNTISQACGLRAKKAIGPLRFVNPASCHLISTPFPRTLMFMLSWWMHRTAPFCLSSGRRSPNQRIRVGTKSTLILGVFVCLLAEGYGQDLSSDIHIFTTASEDYCTVGRAVC